MATSAEHMAARSDNELVKRLESIAEMSGIPSASDWVQRNIGQLMSVPIADNQCIADVYSTASNTYNQALAALPPTPGSDLEAVPDLILHTAVNTLLMPVNPPSN